MDGATVTSASFVYAIWKQRNTSSGPAEWCCMSGTGWPPGGGGAANSPGRLAPAAAAGDSKGHHLAHGACSPKRDKNDGAACELGVVGTFKKKLPSALDVIREIRNSIELWRLAGAECLESPFGEPP